MPSTLGRQVGAAGVHVGRALSPFMTRTVGCGAAVACVLGMGLGSWAKPPAPAERTDTMQPVATPYAASIAPGATQADWQTTTATGYQAPADSLAWSTTQTATVQPVADRQTARAPDAWEVADADPTSQARDAQLDASPATPTAAQAGDKDGDDAPAPPSPPRWPSVDGEAQADAR